MREKNKLDIPIKNIDKNTHLDILIKKSFDVFFVKCPSYTNYEETEERQKKRDICIALGQQYHQEALKLGFTFEEIDKRWKELYPPPPDDD